VLICGSPCATGFCHRRRQVEFGEGEEMISLRPAVLAVLVAAAFAGCLTYFVTPPPRVEVDPLLPATVPDMKLPDAGTPTSTDQRRSAEERSSAFERAAAAILKRASYAEASASTVIAGHVPLPKRRPIPR
jgi:uncharacterized membrane protein